MLGLLQQIFNKEGEFFGLVHSSKVNIFSALTVEDDSDFNSWYLDEVFRESSDFEAIFFEFEDYFFFGLIEDEHIVFDGEVDAYVDVLSLWFLQFWFETFVL